MKKCGIILALIFTLLIKRKNGCFTSDLGGNMLIHNTTSLLDHHTFLFPSLSFKCSAIISHMQIRIFNYTDLCSYASSNSTLTYKYSLWSEMNEVFVLFAERSVEMSLSSLGKACSSQSISSLKLDFKSKDAESKVLPGFVVGLKSPFFATIVSYDGNVTNYTMNIAFHPSSSLLMVDNRTDYSIGQSLNMKESSLDVHMHPSIDFSLTASSIIPAPEEDSLLHDDVNIIKTIVYIITGVVGGTLLFLCLIVVCIIPCILRCSHKKQNEIDRKSTLYSSDHGTEGHYTYPRSDYFFTKRVSAESNRGNSNGLIIESEEAMSTFAVGPRTETITVENVSDRHPVALNPLKELQKGGNDGDDPLYI